MTQTHSSLRQPHHFLRPQGHYTAHDLLYPQHDQTILHILVFLMMMKRILILYVIVNSYEELPLWKLMRHYITCTQQV